MKLIRKVSVAKWKQCLKVSQDHLSADAITGCLRTQDNTLSLWRSDSKADEEKAILALSSSLTQVATISYVYLDSEILEGDDLKIIESDGQTAALQCNSLHRDIVELDHSALARVARHVKNKIANDEFLTLTKPELRSILLDGLDDGSIDASRLDKKLLAELEKAREKKSV